MSADRDLKEALSLTLRDHEVDWIGLGGAVAVARNGELAAACETGEAWPGIPWSLQTRVLCWSVSKGIASIVMAKLIEDRVLDPNQTVASVWPEFAAAQKDSITLSDVMTHRAGLPWLCDSKTSPHFGNPATMGDRISVAHTLSTMSPIAKYKGKTAYHALTFGWLLGEIVHRAVGCSIGEWFQNQMAHPYGLNMAFSSQVREIENKPARLRVPPQGERAANDFDLTLAEPESPMRQALLVPTHMRFSDMLATTGTDAFLATENAAVSLVSDAVSLARLYSLFASGQIVSPKTVATVTQRLGTHEDLVTGGMRSMALGFVLNSPDIAMSPSEVTFGHPGLGGSLALGDAQHGLGFAYLTNAMVPGTGIDPRARKLVDVAYSRL